MNLDFQPPELWGNKFLLFKPPHLWCSVTAACADRYRKGDCQGEGGRALFNVCSMCDMYLDVLCMSPPHLHMFETSLS